jgi:hypothetical protein
MTARKYNTTLFPFQCHSLPIIFILETHKTTFKEPSHKRNECCRPFVPLSEPHKSQEIRKTKNMQQQAVLDQRGRIVPHLIGNFACIWQLEAKRFVRQPCFKQ